MNPSDAFHRATRSIRGRIQMMVGRGVVTGVDDAPRVQSIQVGMLADEMHDGAERFGTYGVASVPFVGAECVVVFPGGLRSHGLVIAIEDRRYRLSGLAEGEVALYDDLGQMVKLGREGIEIETPMFLTIKATEEVMIQSGAIRLDAATVTLGGSDSSARIARVGDSVVNGKIVGGSDRVFAS